MIERKKYIEMITPWIGKEKIIVLKWARQVGKTTLMQYFEKYLQQQNEQTAFIFADDLQNTFLDTPAHLIEYLKLKYGLWTSKKKLYVFIDEFQYIKNAGLFLKNIFDAYKDSLQLIVSGSSSLEITKNTEFLTWRTITFYIDRLSFREVFSYTKGIDKTFQLPDIEEIKTFYTIFKHDLELSFMNYLVYGGYPEWVITSQKDIKEKVLWEILKVYIEKDVSYFLKIENIKAFNDLIKLLASNIGELVNIHELSSILDISMQTVKKYLDILEGTFIFSRVKPFFSNIRKELSKMPKIFVEDLAIRSYVLWDFSPLHDRINIGQEVENFIYNELRKQKEKEKIYFYRTLAKSEIDFVLERKYQLYDLVEVKYRKKVPIPVSMKNFEKKYKVQHKIIITKDICEYKDGVYFLPACVFGFVEV